MCLGIPAQVTQLLIPDSPLPMGEICMRGELRPCCFAYVPEATIGDWVLIQNGFAMTLLSAEEAAEVLQALDDIDAPVSNNVADTGESASSSPQY